MSGSVIYLDPKPNPLAQVGQGLQSISQLAQNIQQAQYNAKKQKVAAQAATITDPAQLQSYAFSQLRPDDATDLVKNLTQIRTQNLLQTRTKQEIDDGAIQIRMDKMKLDEQPLVFSQQQKLTASEIRQRNAEASEAAARAAAIPSEVARNNAEAGEAKMRTAVEFANYKSALDWQKNLLGDGKTSQIPPDASPAVRAAHAAPPTVGQDAVTALKNYRLGKVDESGFITSLPPPALPSIQSTNQYHLPQNFVDSLKGMPPEKAMEALNKEVSKGFSKTEDVQVAPGFFQRVGFYPDGSWTRMGEPYEKLAKPTEQDERQVSGLDMWQSTVEALKTLRDGGKIGDATTRTLIQGMRALPGGDAMGFASSLKGGSAAYAYDSLLQHATLAAAQMFPRQSNVTIQAAQHMLPPYNSNKAQFDAAIRASENLTDQAAYTSFNERLADGKPIPASLADYVRKRGLDKLTPDQINAKVLGIEGLPTVEKEGGGSPENAGGNRVNRGAEAPPMPVEGGSSPPENNPNKTPSSSILRYDSEGNLVQ